MRLTDKLLTVGDVAALLGMTKIGIYQAVYHKRIPAIKISRKCVRFDPVDIQKWLEEKKTQVVETEPKQPVRSNRAIGRSPGRSACRSTGRPRKSPVNSSYIDRIVEQVRKEVGV